MASETAEERERRLVKRREYARAYYAANRDKIRKQKLDRYHLTRDVQLAYKDKYRQSHPDASRQYYIANKDRILQRTRASGKAWRSANPGRGAAYMAARRAADPIGERKRNTDNRRKWLDDNREKARLAVHRALAKRALAEGSFTDDQWHELLAACGGVCLRCKATGCEAQISVDHIVPLARGGTNWIWNLQPLCITCNKSKHARQIVDYRPRHVRERFGPHD